MHAILLAAGVGRRLASLEQLSPKCLLRFDGHSLLLRHLDILQSLGFERTLIVVGHMDHMIREEAARWKGTMAIDFAYNGEFRRGSILSLKAGLGEASRESDQVVMDADVLYDREVLRRLAEGPFGNGFLLDPRSHSEGEEMMLGVKDDRVCTISRNIGTGWDLVGEGIGFFKIQAEDVAQLDSDLTSLIDEGKLDADYEDGIDVFLQKRPAYYATVNDLPWTEIDFDEDVETARNEVLPRLSALPDPQPRAEL